MTRFPGTELIRGGKRFKTVNSVAILRREKRTVSGVDMFPYSWAWLGKILASRILGDEMWFSSREEYQLHHHCSNCPQSPAPHRLTHWLPEKKTNSGSLISVQKWLNSCLPLHPSSIHPGPLPTTQVLIRWVITLNGISGNSFEKQVY